MLFCLHFLLNFFFSIMIAVLRTLSVSNDFQAHTILSYILCLSYVFVRFLTLKNLATVFLEQGSAHYENALKCYLQAVELDQKDSVVWNQLGTLSCMMGLLSISRWAFEQGLYCSPNNCM